MPTAEPKQADAVVIGGGIIGTSIALNLADAGLSVVLVEKGAGPVEGSTRNGGGVRAQCRNRAERLLAIRSLELWRELQSRTGEDFEYTVSGNLRLAFDEERLEGFRAEQQEELEDGLATEIWTGKQLTTELPFISPSVLAAKFCASDGHANPILATWAIVREARARGVWYLVNTEAEAIGTKAGAVESVTVRDERGRREVTTPHVIHAAGAWSRGLASGLGVDLPIVPARNVLMLTEPLPPMFDAFISSHEKQVYLRQARKGHVHIGGVFDVRDTFDQTVTTEELEKLARATEIVPSLANASVLRSWGGTIDFTPDHKPLIGTVDAVPGYIVAAGFSGHGFCLGPVVGECVANLILGRPSTADLGDLAPGRFPLS